MTEHWIRIDGRRVRYLETGAGAPVIFVAGLGISADFYKHNMRALAEAGFRAIAPDLPGFGATRGRWFGSTVSELGNHLAAFARQIGVTRAHWIGHSIGCQVALHLAAQHPDLVRSIVLSGPTGGYGHRLLRQMRAIAYHAVNEPWRLMKAVLRDYVRLSPFTYIGTWIKAGRHDPLAVAPAVQCPVLILMGADDRVPGAKFTAQLQHKLDRVEVVRLAGGQHGLPRDAQEQFDRAVIRFLRS